MICVNRNQAYRKIMDNVELLIGIKVNKVLYFFNFCVVVLFENHKHNMMMLVKYSNI